MELILGTLDHSGNARIAWYIDISEMGIFRLTEHPGAPPLKGNIPHMQISIRSSLYKWLQMGRSSKLSKFQTALKW